MLYLYKEQEIKNLVDERRVKIAFIGLGRVGLPLAATLADAGFSVVGIDINPETVSSVNSANTPYADEEGLDQTVYKNVVTGMLSATSDFSAVTEADIIIIAVPTLIRDEQPDIEAVIKVAGSISPYMNPGKVVVLQSTVPPGTTEFVLGEIITKNTSLKAGRDFGLAYSPERTQSPQVLKDLKTYPKIVGGIDGKSTLAIAEVYSTFAPSIIQMKSIVAAELDKVVENTYRDVNIAFANELALLCQLYGVDVQEMISTANSQPYCHILQPGLVGGHCIPMDPYYIISDATKRGFSPPVIKAARALNEEMFNTVAGMVENNMKNVTVLGLSFKPGVKSFDTSHTPRLVKKLEQKGCRVTVHDPFLGNDIYSFQTEPDLYQAISGADCVILSTAHAQYKELDFFRVKDLMKGNLIIDIRAVWDPDAIKVLGLKYKGLGRTFND